MRKIAGAAAERSESRPRPQGANTIGLDYFVTLGRKVKKEANENKKDNKF